MASLRSPRLLAVALVLVPALVPAAAQAGPPPPASTNASTAAARMRPAPKATGGAGLIKRTAHLASAAAAQHVAPGTSIGSPTEGHLLGGAHLAETPYLRIVPTYAAGDVRWGLEPLVGMIDRAARTVNKQFSDSMLSVGHLSKPGGGELERHASHESGRDADIGFYVKSQAGKLVYEDHFVAFLGDGTAPTWPGARFDDARNWALVASLLSDGRARITHVFVATPLRARLLAYAEKIGAPPSLRARAAEVMAQPHGALPHDDHFHVRIACPSGMDKCIELPSPRHHAHAHGHAQDHAVAAASPHHPAASAPAGAHHPAAAEKSAPPKDTTAKSETSTPSLAQDVPGLDSAVIAVPLAGASKEPEKTEKTEAAPAPKADPIDDPDGVLEGR